MWLASIDPKYILIGTSFAYAISAMRRRTKKIADIINTGHILYNMMIYSLGIGKTKQKTNIFTT
jgi:hypothetical protein